jgi:hypothetical protein
MLIPVTKIIDVKSEILGTFVLTVPLIFIFIARLLMVITGGMYLLLMHILQISPVMQTEAAYMVSFSFN